MNEIRYMISDASKMVEVESHVLRYWEEELSLEIPRNELGHRYYRETDIQTFRTIRILKEQGFQLRAIRMLLPNIDPCSITNSDYMKRIKREWLEKLPATGLAGLMTENSGEGQLITFPNSVSHSTTDTVKDSSVKMEQFRSILKDVISQSIAQNTSQISKDISSQITKELNYLYQNQEQQQEERFRHFDETLRSLQLLRQEVAAMDETNHTRKSKFWKRSKKQNTLSNTNKIDETLSTM